MGKLSQSSQVSCRPYSAVQYFTMHYSAVQYFTMHYSAVQLKVVQSVPGEPTMYSHQEFLPQDPTFEMLEKP